MSRGSNIGIGLFLIVIGVIVTAVSYSAAAGGGRYVVAWGAILVGVIRLVRGLAAPDTPPPSVYTDEEEAAQGLGRNGPSQGDQLVGRACAECGSKIISVTDGEMCHRCNAPVHMDCKAIHREAHAKRGSAGASAGA